MNTNKDAIIVDGKTYIDAQSLVDWLDKLIDPYRGTITHFDDKGNILSKEDSISLDGAHYVKIRREVLKRMQDSSKEE